jgi:hypothetical protein
MMDFSARFPTELLDRYLESVPQTINKGAAEGLAVALEAIRGIIASETIGGAKWNGLEHGKDGGYHPKAYAMAHKIARREGHSDFRHGQRTSLIGNVVERISKSGKLTRRRPKVTIGRGTGWSRVLELVGKMAHVRPASPQKVWIQSGELRKSLDTAVRADGLNAGDVVGLLIFRTTYAEGLHKKYPFAEPVIEDQINNGEVAHAVQDGILRAIREHRANS